MTAQTSTLNATSNILMQASYSTEYSTHSMLFREQLIWGLTFWWTFRDDADLDQVEGART